MVIAAKTLPNATIIGDTTNGTFGTKISRELSNGWFYSCSIQKLPDHHRTAAECVYGRDVSEFE